MSWLRRARGDGSPRPGLLLFALLQLLVTAGLPAGDAALEAAATASGLHVESAADEPCGHGHDHDFCQTCRALGLPGLPGPAAARSRLARPGVHLDPLAASPRAPSERSLPGSLGARAPPAG